MRRKRCKDFTQEKKKASEFGLKRMSRSLLGKDGEKDIAGNVMSENTGVGRHAA